MIPALALSLICAFFGVGILRTAEAKLSNWEPVALGCVLLILFAVFFVMGVSQL